MADVIALDMCPVNAAANEVPRGRVKGCVVVSVDRDGLYFLAECAMTPEQMLAAAERVREVALDLLDERRG
ncbi:MAG: hypothetical protein ACLFVU_01955 [Phycisphaerae bacterium]